MEAASGLKELPLALGDKLPEAVPLRESTICAPALRRFGLCVELVRASLRRRKETGLQLEEALAQRYFQARSAAGAGFDDTTESTTDWYLSPLDGLRAELASRAAPLSVLDLGSGRGGLLRWFMSRGIDVRYVGLDSDRVAVARCGDRFGANGRFVVADVYEPPPMPWPVDVLFAVNVLPYLANPAAAFAAWAALANERSELVVIDPAPSAFWDREFEGFRVQIRERSELLKAAGEAGWAPIDAVRLTIGPPAPDQWDIANTIRFRLQGGARL